jgi:hypothetical protein
MSRLIAVVMAVALAPAAALADGSEVEAEHDPGEDVADQEIGARLGLRMGGRSTPGGLNIGGVFLYRLSDVLWSDSSIAFSVGGGGAECFRDRGDNVLCDHGQLDGVAGGAHSGVRWVQRGKQGFVPYVRATVGLELVNYSDDDVRGIAVPVVLGGGVRARVADRVSVGGGADLHIGIARFNRDIGAEPQVALTVKLGVDFAL